ncbi:MAG: TerB family tellurite resistance protein [Pseudomonadota bacterium]
MHIVAGLVTLLTVAGIAAYRFYLLSQSPLGQGVADAAGEVRKGMRRRAWRKKLGDPLRDVDDPRIAAAALMTALAQSDGALTARDEALLASQMQTAFGADAAAVGELGAYARWLVRDVTEPETCFLKVRRTLLEKCGPEERASLVGMLEKVANAGADPDTRRAFVSHVARALAP